MSKELEALEAFDEVHCVAYGMKVYDSNTVEAEKIIETALKKQKQDENKLKALEIIKEKSVDIGFLQFCSFVDTYNKYILEHAWTKHTRTLTQEEYDLLKEVLL